MRKLLLGLAAAAALSTSASAALNNAVSGALSSATNSQATPFGPYTSQFNPGYFNLLTSGTFVATYQVVRSIDGGTTWVPLTSQGSVLSFTGPINEVLLEGQAGTLYAILVTSYTSGTLNYQFKQ